MENPTSTGKQAQTVWVWVRYSHISKASPMGLESHGLEVSWARARGTSVVECSLCKHKDLSLNLSIHVKRGGMVACTCDSSAGKLGPGDSLGLGGHPA